MGSSIEEVANNWLKDPSWQRVFKHTFDVIEDYVSYALVTVGTISLSVRLLTTLSSGDLMCIMVGVLNATDGSITPYASGGTLGMINYAQTEESCIRAILTPFIEFLPYIMLLETLLLVVVEKFTFRIPRIAQKVERFYKNIVEDSLFGKDPDAAEDMTDIRTSTEAISRKRQRIEICMSLKQSSIIYRAYIGKNLLEVAIVAFFFTLNLTYALIEGKLADSARCRIPILAFPELSIEDGEVYFQCRGKKMSFFMMALWVQNVLLAMHGLLSVFAVAWCWRFRAVTNLLRTIEEMRNAGSEDSLIVGQADDGKDFLFLFDLLAHTCGLEATLRVLTHSDDNFYSICRPNLDPKVHLLLEEDKVKISWMPALIETWLRGGKGHTRSQRAITINCYEVTIFPAETVMNTQTISTKIESAADNMYHAWFYDLQGGRTEYVITIACMIGKSRMKGEKVVTTLVPYGPEKPRSGMVKQAGTKQVEIFWDPPKGEFTKYILVINRVGSLASAMGLALSNSSAIGRDSPINFQHMHSINTGSLQSTSLPDRMPDTQFDRSSLRHMENLSYKLTTYTILGLDPGEMFFVELGTKTGNVVTRQTIAEAILTRPLPVSGLMASDISIDTCSLHWLPPEGHTFLRGFQLVVQQSEGKILKNMAIAKTKKSFSLSGMAPATDYDIVMTTLCVAPDGKKTESEPAAIIVTTMPDPVRNLHVEKATPNSVLARWDAVPAFPMGATAKVRLTIECASIEYSASVEVPCDCNQYNFTNLPDPDGSGCMYTVMATVGVMTLRETEVSSLPATALVNTIPHQPGNLTVGKNSDDPLEICFARSVTPAVTKYRMRWKKGGAEEARAEEAVLEASAAGEDGEVKFKFPQLAAGSPYEVNVCALAELGDKVLESKEVHGKVVLREETNVLEVCTEES